MATAVLKNGNGKRERNQMEPEDPEFVPLSKRINNLHLHQSQNQQNDSHNSHGQPIASSHHQQHQQQRDSSAVNFNGGVETASNHNLVNGSHFNSTISPSGQDERSQQQQHHHHHHHHQIIRNHDNSVHAFNTNHSTIVSNQSNSSSTNDRISHPSNSGHQQHHGQAGNNFDLSKINNHNQQHHHQQQNSNIPQNHMLNYNPVLDASANPHYYEPNRQLYLLYLERMQRNGQQLHENFFL